MLFDENRSYREIAYNKIMKIRNEFTLNDDIRIFKTGEINFQSESLYTNRQ